MHWMFSRHHRSDAYSSIVSLVAIVGSYAGIPVLDPIGGLIVSAMIIKSGNGILMSSLRELMDKGMDHETITDISQAITEIKVCCRCESQCFCCHTSLTCYSEKGT